MHIASSNSEYSINSLFSGYLSHLIPNKWYHIIVNKSGNPDHNSISILSEIVYWYRPKAVYDYKNNTTDYISKFKGDIWQTSYSHFENKFSYNHQRVRRALVRLEELGIIERQFQTVSLRGQKYNNVLFIKLNIDVLNNLTTKSKNYVAVEVTDLNTQSSNILKANFVAPSLQECRDHIDNKIKENNNRSRSNESNFCEKNLKEKKDIKNTIAVTSKTNPILEFTTVATLQQANNPDLGSSLNLSPRNSNILPGTSQKTPITEKIKSYFSNSSKKFIDYYPLSEEDTELLAKNSEREFNHRFINQLLLKFSEKYPDNVFYNKKRFMNYMTIVLREEMKQAEQANRETNTDCNSYSDITYSNNLQAKNRIGIRPSISIDSYLNEIESSKDTSLLSQLKREIVGHFDSKIAYILLSRCQFKEKLKEGQVIQLILDKGLELSSYQRDRLQSLVRAVYGEETIKLNIVSSNIFNTSSTSNKPTGSFAESANQIAQSDRNNYISAPASTPAYTHTPILPSNQSIWHEIRQKLKSYFNNGEALDKSWFSKLEIVESDDDNDTNNKTITLKGANGFICSYIKQHYWSFIEKCCNEMNYKLNELVT